MGREELLKPLRYGRSVVATAAHGFPSHNMLLIGVTGTDGKTTTSNLIYHILSTQKKKVGLVSTIAAKIFDGEKETEIDTGFHVTTPDSFDIQKLLKQMVDAGCEIAVIECTSHALAQERLAGLNFDIGVVTNITHEHLDYHKTLEKYVMAKALLFKRDTMPTARKPKMSVAILNQDDQSWDSLKPYVAGWNVVGYGFSDFSTFRMLNTEYSVDGTKFSLVQEDTKGDVVTDYLVDSPLVADYNVANVTAALAACKYAGISVGDGIKAIKTFKNLPGRFELINSEMHGKIIVDFAHTPHAIERVIHFAKSNTKGNVIVVFGSAGLRDVEKRYLMGRVAGKYADISIVTAEDPRTERVENISAQIAKGIVEEGAEEYPPESLADLGSEEIQKILSEHVPLFMRVSDRRKAIITGIGIATDDDIVLILGKGHEKSMCFGTKETPWSDQEVVKEALKLLED